jgi:hypothetical protein
MATKKTVADPSDSMKPFHVQTTDQQNLTKGFMKEADAKKDAEARSKRAEDQGLSTRYEVVKNPKAS